MLPARTGQSLRVGDQVDHVAEGLFRLVPTVIGDQELAQVIAVSSQLCPLLGLALARLHQCRLRLDRFLIDLLALPAVVGLWRRRGAAQLLLFRQHHCPLVVDLRQDLAIVGSPVAAERTSKRVGGEQLSPGILRSGTAP